MVSPVRISTSVPLSCITVLTTRPVTTSPVLSSVHVTMGSKVTARADVMTLTSVSLAAHVATKHIVKTALAGSNVAARVDTV